MVISLNHRPERYIPANKKSEKSPEKKGPSVQSCATVNTNLHAQNN
jgi:hypothetical protein